MCLCRLRWLERELGRGNPHLRAQGEGEAREVAEVAEGRRDRAAWERRQLLECVHHFLAAGAAVTLLTGDTEVLSGEAEVPPLEGDWRIEDLETFEGRALGEGRGRGHGAREGRAARRRGRGGLGSPEDEEASKG